ncbi:Nmad5 family putative nucleotide modification protein [Novosphingobium sp.]|uniref:Nmad5 family putative nucleotide modification protein n=1 Tax=Novosphingobium sp. TaxID=1874826 RepID=UPI002638B348|nr:Nmad5 family putative nucleotide modification protein [Novosphingobium sp.]
MSRITNQIRQAIALDLLDLRFTKTGEELLAENAQLFELAYCTRYASEVRGLMEKLQSASGKKALRTSTKIECRTSSGYRITVGSIRLGTEKWAVRGEGVWRPIFEQHCNTPLLVDAETELDARLQKFATDQQAFVDAISKAHAEAMAALNSINTAAQMEKVWPEALPFLSKHLLPPAKPNLPAVQFQHLNAAFGLPVEVAA